MSSLLSPFISPFSTYLVWVVDIVFSLGICSTILKNIFFSSSQVRETGAKISTCHVIHSINVAVSSRGV